MTKSSPRLAPTGHSSTRRSMLTIWAVSMLVVGACSSADEGTEAPGAATTAATTTLQTTATKEAGVAIEASDLHGVWLTASQWYTEFDDDTSFGNDGTFRVTTIPPPGSPFEEGTYALEGNLLTFHSAGRASGCTPEPAIYETSFTPDGDLNLSLVEDPCTNRAHEFSGPLIRHPAEAAEEAPSEDATSAAVATVEAEIAAANRGDVTAQIASYDPAGVFLGPARAGGGFYAVTLLPLPDQEPIQTVEEYLQFQATLNTRLEITEPCEEVVMGSVRCVLRHTSDLLRAAGLEPELRHTVRFDDAGLIAGLSVTGDGAAALMAFYRAFGVWMEEAQSAAYAQIWEEGGGLAFKMTGETARLFSQYVEDFIAASPDYP